MTKFILEIDDNVKAMEAIEVFRSVVEGGRISKTRAKFHHCHLTVCRKTGIHCGVYMNKNSERFVIWRPATEEVQ